MTEKTALLVEVNEASLLRLERVLRQSHFKVLTSSTFGAAFQLLKSSGQALSLIMLDFELATNEPDIMERLRRLDFERPVPVILLGEVPLSGPEIKQLCRDSGYASYIYKSMREDEMLKRVKEVALPDDSPRKHVRIHCQKRVHCQFLGQNTVTETFNLSVGGMFLRMNQNFPPIGARGTVTLILETPLKVNLKLDVEVIYLKQLGDNTVSIFPSGIGVKFTRLGAQEKQYLALLIEEGLRKNRARENASEI